jgi:parallel beta-helix repeat protein
MQSLLRATSPAVLALAMLAYASQASSARRAAADVAFAVAASNARVVQVAPPKGVRDADRRSILSALEQSGPGDTIQFAPGTYLVGELIRVAVPRVTLVGHPDGTTLRGCDPAGFVEVPVALVACNGLELTGGHQSVRNLTFEYAWHGLVLGCCWSDRVASRTDGGHRVEGNTFRYSSNGIRLIGDAPEPSVIRSNRFIDVYHAVGVNGMTAHILNNDISVPEPERVPIAAIPSFAVSITAGGPPPGWREEVAWNCRSNVIAGNRIEGHPDGIALVLMRAGASCRQNVFRDNTIVVGRVKFARKWGPITIRSEGDSSVVGIPIALVNAVNDSGRVGVLEDNLVEGNRVIGASGLGIEIYRASRNRIVNNTITGVRRRDPFPGNTLTNPPRWHEGNGSAIWVSRGSDENEIVGNTFADIAANAVVLEGDRNRVTIRSATDRVRQLGTGNRVTLPR